MADAITARSALEGLLKRGRHGRGDGAAGVALAELQGVAIASVIARKGKAGEASAVAERDFGVALPHSPRRVKGKGVEFIWAGPEQWLALARGGLPAGELEVRLATAFAGLASVAEQSDGRCLLRISGARARDADRHPDLATRRNADLRARGLPRLRPQLLAFPDRGSGGIRLRGRRRLIRAWRDRSRAGLLAMN